MLTDALATLDQPSATDICRKEEAHFLDLSERVLEQSLAEGSFDFAWTTIEGFRAMNKASSLAMSSLLHGVKSHYGEVESEETFIQQAIRRTGYSQLTIERYIAVWELLRGDLVPEEFRENIQSQTMRQLVKEASLVVEQGYELEHDDWRDLSEAADEHRVAEISARIKGKPRNKNHMSLKVDEDGFIHAYQGNEEELVGQLFTESASPMVQKAIRRIMESSAITKRSDY